MADLFSEILLRGKSCPEIPCRYGPADRWDAGGVSLTFREPSKIDTYSV